MSAAGQIIILLLSRQTLVTLYLSCAVGLALSCLWQRLSNTETQERKTVSLQDPGKEMLAHVCGRLEKRPFQVC